MLKITTKLFLLFTISITLGLGSLACQPRTDFTIHPNANCQPPSSLQKILQKEASVPACLVLLWKGQPQEISAAYPVKLMKDGTLLFRSSDDDFKEAGDFEIPKEARGQALLFRIYVLNSEANTTKINGHKAVCNLMGTTTYNCFSPKNKGCWMSFLFAPTTPQDHYKIFPLEGNSCKVCQPETCDKKDNNCNGLTDEYDEVNKKACE